MALIYLNDYFFVALTMFTLELQRLILVSVSRSNWQNSYRYLWNVIPHAKSVQKLNFLYLLFIKLNK